MPPAVEAPPVAVSVVAPARPAAGAAFEAAIVLDVPAGWHVYWENPGQSGLATDVALRAGDRVASGPAWPAPVRFDADGIVNYGYTGPTGFVFTVPAAPAGPLALTATASWLLCRDVCVRGEGSARLDVTVVASADGAATPATSGTAAKKASPRAATPAPDDPVAPYRARLPRPFAESGGTATVTAVAGGAGTLAVRVPGPGPFAVFPSVPLEGAWTPTAREADGALLLDATFAGPVPTGAHLVVTRGTGPDRAAFTLDVPPEAPR